MNIYLIALGLKNSNKADNEVIFLIENKLDKTYLFKARRLKLGPTAS